MREESVCEGSSVRSGEMALGAIVKLMSSVEERWRGSWCCHCSSARYKFGSLTNFNTGS